MNLPIEFEKKMKAFLGNEWEEFLYSYDNNRFQALRFNTLKVGKNKSVEEEIAGIMDKLGIPMDKKVTWANDAYYYDEKNAPGSIRIMRWGFTTYRSQAQCRRLLF